MRKSRFSEEQIIAILKESEAGVGTEELCRRHGITRACFYRWKGKFGGMRRACGLMELHRATCRYRRLRGEDAQLRARLRELAEARRRFGYRRLQVLLQREGWRVNHKRIYRLYVEDKLSLRRKRGRKRSRVRQPLPEAVAANQVWSVDFMTDAFSSGRRFRILNVVDDYTGECLAIEADTSLGGVRVVRVLEELRQRRGLPRKIRSDNGPEFVSRAVDQWPTSMAWSGTRSNPGDR